MGGVLVEPRKIQTTGTLKSNVRSYSRSFPAVFSRARGTTMLTDDVRMLIDFLSGAGAQRFLIWRKVHAL